MSASLVTSRSCRGGVNDQSHSPTVVFRVLCSRHLPSTRTGSQRNHKPGKRLRPLRPTVSCPTSWRRCACPRQRPAVQVDPLEGVETARCFQTFGWRGEWVWVVGSGAGRGRAAGGVVTCNTRSTSICGISLPTDVYNFLPCALVGNALTG